MKFHLRRDEFFYEKFQFRTLIVIVKVCLI